MTHQKDIKELRQLFENYLSQNILPESPAGLYEPVDYILQTGGKRLRSVLCLLACQLFGKDAEKALDMALAIEVFHNFTLVHDDLMDEADLRRGRMTIHKKYNEHTAVLSGDLMLIKVYEYLNRIDNPQVLQSILKVFNQTAIEVCEGQQYDMDFEQRMDVGLEEYIKMITLKTAVLIAASLKTGAILGGASPEDAQNLYDFGKNTGIAFQLQDDFLDTYGDTEKFGKKIGGDIIRNKKTFLLVYALNGVIGNGFLTYYLNNWLEMDTKNDEGYEQLKITGVTEIYDRLNVKEAVQTAMQKYYDSAFEYLNNISSLSEKQKQPLIDLVDALMKREI